MGKGKKAPPMKKGAKAADKKMAMKKGGKKGKC